MFSQDNSRWEILIPGATNSHKGIRNPNKKSKPKGSELRRENLFNGAPGVRIANAPVTERSKDLRTAEQKAAIIPWAQRIVKQYPYQTHTPETGTNPSIYISPLAPSIPPAPSVGPALQATIKPTVAYQYSNMIGEFLTRLEQLSATTTDPIALGPGTSLSRMAQSSSVPPSAPSSSTPVISASTSNSTAPSDPTSITVDSSTVELSSVTPTADVSMHDTDGDNANMDSPTRTLKMAHGKLITFRECDIPDPPAVSYAKSIEELPRVWDDNSPDWNGTSPLSINNTPIPLVYWPTVYKYWKGTQWKGVKKTWFDWKILVRAMSGMSMEDFWVHFSAPDKFGQLHPLKYTPLLARLAAERKVADEKLADLARHELTTEQLTYRKGAQLHVMTKPAMIAACYRRLKGIDVDDEGDDDK
ncbi:hypothetical protein DFH07DRAFT_985795 [Mycena maculata]|uniref:Uncharacterized protein n=1 Tax=Mycena maculata TaxID=230809 RepID=A0AAD7I9N2_9AGAR|nr:hypothetical protein DFH07DRAFT_985795 [Mycena maculata]